MYTTRDFLLYINNCLLKVGKITNAGCKCRQSNFSVEQRFLNRNDQSKCTGFGFVKF